MHKELAFSRKTRKLLTAIILLGIVIVLSYLFPRFGFIVFIPIIGLVFLLNLIIYELRVQLYNKESSLLVPLITLSIPIQAFLIRTIPVLLAAQLSIFLIILFYFQIYTPLDRVEYIRKIKPLFLPTLAFACSIILSYLIAGNLQRNNWVFLLSLLGSVGYAYLACIYCKVIQNIKIIFWIFIGIGVIQLPFLFAQSRGWMDWLPANLHMFTSTAWGGTASSVSVLRYGGMFGDYEILAEYLDIAVLICIGMLMFTFSRKERFFAFISLGLILAAGFYTGSRSFILGLGIGLAVMTFMMIIRPGFSKKLVNLLIILSILVMILYFLSTQEIFSGYIARFLKTDIGLHSFDTRSTVWKVSFYLMQKIPFTGYGAQMVDLFKSTSLSMLGSVYDYPHSVYFTMFLIAGYPGLISIIFMVFSPILWMVRRLFDRHAEEYHAWAIVLLAVWIFFAIDEIIVEFTRQPFYMNIIFLLLGIMASLYNLEIKESINNKGLSI